jgi:hypothetical protein
MIAPRSMRRTNVLPLLGVAVAIAAARAGAAAAGAPPRGLEPIGSSEWPAVAARLARDLARDALAHDDARVWAYLDPALRRAVSSASWRRCRRVHPVAPPGVTIERVAVASATEVAIGLGPLGRRKVQEIELQVQFRTPARPGLQAALLPTFWLERGRTWTAVWPSEEYAAYAAGRCYGTPGGPPLY